MTTREQVTRALEKVIDPGLKKSITALKMVKDLAISDGLVQVTLALTTTRCPMKNKLVESIKHAVSEVPGIRAVEVKLTKMEDGELRRLVPHHPLKGIGKTKQFLAVASGKGGVGKTTVAINLALSLLEEGLQVGLLDADVYGPSIPTMLGLTEKPDVESGMIIPLEKFGLKIMSFGFLFKPDQPLIWRGPLVGKTIRQFLDEVMWGDLDYLVIDLPPGTGDASITVAQSIPAAGAVIVTTPQEVALADVRKAIAMFRSMDVRILGIVENMAYFAYGEPQEKIEIFGKGGGEKLSKEYDLPFLGGIPIDLDIRESGDSGVPLVVNDPEAKTSSLFRGMAKKVMAFSNELEGRQAQAQ